jgi:hypothetical protein
MRIKQITPLAQNIRRTENTSIKVAIQTFFAITLIAKLVGVQKLLGIMSEVFFQKIGLDVMVPPGTADGTLQKKVHADSLQMVVQVENTVKMEVIPALHLAEGDRLVFFKILVANRTYLTLV